MYTSTAWRQATMFHLEPFLGKVYFKSKHALNEDDAYRILDQGIAPDELVVESSDGTGPPSEQLPSPVNASATVKLLYGSYNRLVFEVESTGPGIFGFAFPYGGRWTSSVNGSAVQPRRANGGSHAVPLPAGHSNIEFRCRSPGTMAGVAISCFALVLLVVFLAGRLRSRVRATAVVVTAMASAIGIFLLFSHSLYAGENLMTAYAWSGPDAPGPRPNLAYGRRTTMSSTRQEIYKSFAFAASKGTDGDRSPSSGFQTELEESPTWSVDLKEVRRIGSIVLFESRTDEDYNRRPILVGISNDGRIWSHVPGKLREAEGGGALVLEPAIPIAARFVLVGATGRSRLSFDEVEIYPPAE